MYGKDINKLVVYALGYDGQKKSVWSKSCNKGNTWYNGSLPVTSQVQWRVRITF